VTALFPQWAGAKVWAGKRYYLREDIHAIDHFYLNVTDGPGVGVQDIDIGMGKLAFSIFGVGGADALDQTVAFVREDLRWYGLPVWTGGTLTFDLNYQSINRHKDLAEPDNEGGGIWATAEWHQDGILGGNNNLAIQYATGCNAGMGPGAPGNTHKDNSQFAVWDSLLLQPSSTFQVNIGGSYQMLKDGATDDKATLYGVFVRPVFWVTDYFKIQGDVAYTAVKPDGADAMNLTKWTIAPTLSPAVGDGGGFFVRPEIRLFVTGAFWNDASQAAGVAGGNYGTDKSGILYGAQVETWF